MKPTAIITLANRLKNLAHYLAQLSPQRLWQVVMAPIRLWEFINKMLNEGYYDVVTEFEVAGKKMAFKTLIQIDGDLINYIPDPTHLLRERKSIKVFRQYHRKHLQNTEGIIKMYEDNFLLFSRFFDLILLAINYFSWLHELLQNPLDLLLSLKAFAILLGTLLFRKYLKPWLIKNAVRLLFKGGKLAFKNLQ